MESFGLERSGTQADACIAVASRMDGPPSLPRTDALDHPVLKRTRTVCNSVVQITWERFLRRESTSSA